MDWGRKHEEQRQWEKGGRWLEKETDGKVGKGEKGKEKKKRKGGKKERRAWKKEGRGVKNATGV